MRQLKIPKRLFAVDFGTTKFCIATLRQNSSGKVAIDCVSVPAAGMKRGMVADRDTALSALNKLIETAEERFDADIKRIVIGVAGSHLRHRTISTHTGVSGQIVQPSDVYRLTMKVEQEYQTDNREILHTVPISYRIDGRQPIEDPVGFSGHKLSCSFFIIDSDRCYLRDMVGLCNQAGLEVDNIWSEPLASASVTVMEAAKQAGVAVIDIGGGTTDGTVFCQGKPTDIFTINIGGLLMTSDLAIGLGIPKTDAEKVKMQFGIHPPNDDVSINVMDHQGKDKLVTWKDVYPILGPRLFELAKHIDTKLTMAKPLLTGGLLLTGGGSEVAGLDKFLSKVLKIPVTREVVRLPSQTVNVFAADSELSIDSKAPKYATVTGLINLQLCRIADETMYKKQTWASRCFGQFFNWIREMS